MITTIDAEKLLVASCLQGRKATLNDCGYSSGIEDDSNDRQLRTIFDVCLALSIQRKEVDALAVQSYLRNNVDELYFSGKDKQKELEAVESFCEDVAADYQFLKQTCLSIYSLSICEEGSTTPEIDGENILRFSDKLQSGSDVEAVLNAGISDLLNAFAFDAKSESKELSLVERCNRRS